MSKELTQRQKDTLKKHSKHHSAKHMAMMKKAMKNGKTFSESHKMAQKKGRNLMAKISTTRLPNATPEYNATQFDVLIRLLEQMINQLNFGYQQDLKDASTARTWFLG